MKGEFYKMDFRAWNIGTVDLTLEQEAAYLRLCHAMYDIGGPVPNSTRMLMGLFRCGNTKATALLAALIKAGKIAVTSDDRLINHRVTEELANREKVSSARRVAGERGGSAPRATNDRVSTDQRVNTDRGSTDTEANGRKPLKDNGADEAIASQPRSRGEETRGDQSKEGDKLLPDDGGRAGYPPKAFEVWWLGYPHKVGKQAAEKAFERVRKAGRVPFQALTDGVQRYMRTKPPDRSYCNPATWLNEGRWDDEPSTGNTGNLFGAPPPGGRRPPAGISAVAAALAGHASRSGIGPGLRQDGPRPGHQGHPRSGRDNSEVEDADWSPAGGHRAAN